MNCPRCSKPLGDDRFCIGPITAPHPATYPRPEWDWSPVGPQPMTIPTGIPKVRMDRIGFWLRRKAV